MMLLFLLLKMFLSVFKASITQFHGLPVGALGFTLTGALEVDISHALIDLIPTCTLPITLW